MSLSRLPSLIALATLCAGLASGPAFAINRYETMRLTCDQVQAIIDREGAAILRYPARFTPGMVLYDRYVRDRHSCLLGEITEFASVPTADRKACTVKRCYRPDPMDDRRVLPRR